MKLWEKIIDKILIIETSVTKTQFGFKSGKSMMKPLFCVKQLVEKYKEKSFIWCLL